MTKILENHNRYANTDKNRNQSIFYLFIQRFFLADSTLFLDFQRKVAIDYTVHRRQKTTQIQSPADSRYTSCLETRKI